MKTHIMKNKELKVKLGGAPLPFILFGYALIITCLGVNWDYWYLIPILLLIGIFLITIKDRLLIDFERKTLYKYTLLLFMKKGEYFDLSEVQYISMVKVNVSQRMYVQSISTTTSETMIMSNLIFSNNKRIQLYNMKYQESLRLNTLIANGLGIKILDITSGEKKWIEPTMKATAAVV